MDSFDVDEIYLIYSILRRSRMLLDKEIIEIISNLIKCIKDVSKREVLHKSIIEVSRENGLDDGLEFDELENFEDKFHKCREAIMNNKKIKINRKYYKKYGNSEIIVTPIWFDCHHGMYILIYKEERARQYSSLYFSLIEEIQILDEEGDIKIINRHYLEEFIGIPWYADGDKITKVKIYVTNGGNAEVFFQERIESKYCRKLAYNSIFTTYELLTNGTQEIINWLLAFGHEVEVLEPASLREQIRDKVKNMYNRQHSSDL